MTKLGLIFSFLSALAYGLPPAISAGEFSSQASVMFDQKIREWDGFGANYVEVRHTRDYEEWPQDYAGFKYLSDNEKQEILELVFGDDGLRVSLLKMFLDPYHEPVPDNGDPHDINLAGFEHARSTKSMRYFAREGLKMTRARGEDLTILAGLYAGPGWAIKQGDWGRDLIPEMKYELAEYLISWVKYLREVENLPVKYLSLHNEEAHRDDWDDDGYPLYDLRTHRLDRGLTWPSDQIVDFLLFMREMLDTQGLEDVGLTPGETVRWDRFFEHGIPQAIAACQQALENLALITSHGFINIDVSTGRFVSKNSKPDGIDLLRDKRPELHAWTTSCKLDGYIYDESDIGFMEQFWLQIYETGVNAIIPWATIHCQWESDRLMDGTFVRSGNRNSPIHVIRTGPDSGHYEIRKGFYFYKQLTRAGRPGMAVVKTMAEDDDIKIIAFAGNGTANQDSLLVINSSEGAKTLKIKLSGTPSRWFTGYLTSEASAGDKNYESVGQHMVEDGQLRIKIPGKCSVVYFGDNLTCDQNPSHSHKVED